MDTNLLSAADLLAGSKAVQDVAIPAAVLQPGDNAGSNWVHKDEIPLSRPSWEFLYRVELSRNSALVKQPVD